MYDSIQKREWSDTDRDERVCAECLDPVLLPEQIEQSSVERRLEDGHLEGVVLVRVRTEVGNLVHRDRLVRRRLRRRVALRNEMERSRGQTPR